MVSAGQTPPSQTEQDVQTRNVDTARVDSFLEVDAQGDVTIYSGKVELGTGLATALAQIVAEELDVAFDRVTIVMGDTALTPDQGGTAGSKSIQNVGPILRQAAAEARGVLLRRASDRLEVPTDALEIDDGVVRVIGDASRSVAFGALAGEPFKVPVAGDAAAKPVPAYTFVGQSVPRVDLLAKVTGGEAFVHDVRLDGMLHGRMVRPHVRTMDGIGATVESMDDNVARKMPGVVEIVRNGSFIGVVAEREEQAIRAAEAIRVTWSDRARLPEQRDYHDLMREVANAGEPVDSDDDVDGALASATRTLAATYQFPFQAHASMGPCCAVADVQEDRVTIYTSSQHVYGLRAAIAPLLGMDEDRVRLIFREGAGCYGHNGADDVSADAAVLSRAVGRPVRVQWMRQDEFAWEPKGPAMVVDMRAGLDATGGVVAWDHDVWTPTHSTRLSGQPGNLLAGQQIDPPVTLRYVGGDRNAPTTYAFPNSRVTMHWAPEAPLRPSALRSLGGLHNTTANEMFLDEVAGAAGIDPVEMRLQYQDDPCAREVIREAAETAGWGIGPSGPKTVAGDVSAGPMIGRGIAYARYEMAFAYVATIAEVEVDPVSGQVRVMRLVVTHDCGQIVNPDGVINQIEGNVIQGVSRTLKEEVTWDVQDVTSLTWESYPILTFPEIPEIEVVLIDRPEEPSFGAGEPAICTVTAAIGNAVFDATGVRLRTVPFTPERVLGAIEAATLSASRSVKTH